MTSNKPLIELARLLAVESGIKPEEHSKMVRDRMHNGDSAGSATIAIALDILGKYIRIGRAGKNPDVEAEMQQYRFEAQ